MARMIHIYFVIIILISLFLVTACSEDKQTTSTKDETEQSTSNESSLSPSSSNETTNDYSSETTRVEQKELDKNLAKALSKKDWNNIKALVKQGADPNLGIGKRKRTALLLAAEGGQSELVHFLLEHDAHPWFTDTKGNNPLHLTSSVIIAETLINSGINPNLANDAGVTPLLQAIESNREEMVSALLKAGANPLVSTSDGKQAIELADEGENEAIIELLIEAGAERPIVDLTTITYVDPLPFETLFQENILAIGVSGQISPLPFKLGNSFQALTTEIGKPDENAWVEGPVFRFGNYFIRTTTGEKSGKITSIKTSLNTKITVQDIIDSIGEPTTYEVSQITGEGITTYSTGKNLLKFYDNGIHQVNTDDRITEYDHSAAVTSLEISSINEQALLDGIIRNNYEGWKLISYTPLHFDTSTFYTIYLEQSKNTSESTGKIIVLNEQLKETWRTNLYQGTNGVFKKTVSKIYPASKQALFSVILEKQNGLNDLIVFSVNSQGTGNHYSLIGNYQTIVGTTTSEGIRLTGSGNEDQEPFGIQLIKIKDGQFVVEKIQ